MESPEAYFRSVTQAVNSCDGILLKRSFNTYGESGRAIAQKLKQMGVTVEKVDRMCDGRVEYADVVALQFKKLICLHCNNSPEEAYPLAVNQIQSYSRLFRDQTTNWGVGAFLQLAGDIRTIALQADAKSGDTTNMSDCASVLRPCWSACNDKTNDLAVTKKMGLIAMTNLLFKSYFHLNTLDMCRNLINGIEKPQFPDLNSFPMSDVVTYQYYTGRVAMFEDNYVRADKQLTAAFVNCHRGASANRRLILQFLVPVKLLVGTIPSPQLLKKYNLTQFSDICASLRVGNMALFNESLDKNQEFFIQRGLYLIMEKLRTVAYRNLLKKVYLINAMSCDGAKKHQLKINKFEAALKWLKIDIDMDEVECILCNMISQKFIKGYISHQMGVLVLSKQEPFPGIREAQMNA